MKEQDDQSPNNGSREPNPVDAAFKGSEHPKYGFKYTPMTNLRVGYDWYVQHKCNRVQAVERTVKDMNDIARANKNNPEVAKMFIEARDKGLEALQEAKAEGKL